MASPPPVTGRTAWDFLTSSLKSSPFIAAIVVAFFGIWGGVHFLAKPGAEVNVLWGLIKYTKDEVAPQATSAAGARGLIASWTIDHGKVKDERSYAFRLLDTGLTVSWSYGKVVFSGASLPKARFSAVDGTGTSLAMFRASSGNWVSVENCMAQCEIEVEVDHRYLLLRPVLDHQNGDARVFAEAHQIPAPNRKLMPFTGLREQ